MAIRKKTVQNKVTRTYTRRAVAVNTLNDFLVWGKRLESQITEFRLAGRKFFNTTN